MRFAVEQRVHCLPKPFRMRRTLSDKGSIIAFFGAVKSMMIFICEGFESGKSS
jgi:hypothetical protein